MLKHGRVYKYGPTGGLGGFSFLYFTLSDRFVVGAVGGCGGGVGAFVGAVLLGHIQ